MRRTLLVAAGVIATLSACSPVATPPAATGPTPSSSTITATAQPLRVESFAAAVVGNVPRDDGGRGQGLVSGTGSLLESTNAAGNGGIRELDPTSGGARTRLIDQPGRTMSGVAFSARPDRPGIIWQLTFHNGVAIARDPSTLAERRRVEYQGEGWGLCDDGTQLVQSDGTMRLILRNADTFAEHGAVEVTGGWWTTGHLGELECVGGAGRREVWANLAGTSWMVRVDLDARAVTAVADLSPVMTAAAVTDVDEAINAIAAIPNARNEFWVSGKGWRATWRIRLVARP